MLEIKELSEENFCIFLCLLLERGEAPENYYRWKYLRQPINNFPTGFIAYFDGVPLGCIGIINKIYIDQFEVKHPATWFADWFVSNAARGKGIGFALIKRVYDLTPYAFGIPGPSKAQIIAKQAGYMIQHNFYEIIIPCQPFLYGYKKYQSNFINRSLRGFKNLWQSGLVLQDNSIEVLEVQNSKNMSSTKRKNCFYQSFECIDWLMNMPIKELNQRKWYKVTDNKSSILVFVEEDFNKNKRARVIDDYYIEKEDRLNFYKRTSKRLAQIDILYLQAYLFLDIDLKVDSNYIKPVSQASSFPLNNFNISLIDLESRWLDIEMK